VSPEALFEVNRGRLAQLAHRALGRGLAARDLLIVCIEVDAWREVVDALMPGRDWQPERDRGETPIARGSAMREGLAEVLSALVPDIAHVLKSRPPPGALHAVALGSVAGRGWGSVFVLVPQPEPN
jgi:hypothetical protein